MTIWRRAAWPLAVFLLALMPRLVDLGGRAFWLDEVFTLQRASLPLGAMIVNSFQNHHMPSFFLLVAPFTKLDDWQFWLRVPPALFGAAAVTLVFMIARRIAGLNAGIVAAMILGLSPIALAYSQEARSYTLEMVLILTALYGLIVLAADLAAAAKPFPARPARAGWLAFTLGTAAALDVLGDGLGWLLTAHLIFLILLAIAPAKKALLRNLLLADLVILLLCAPFYALMLHYQIFAPATAMGWIPELNLHRLWYSLGSVFFMHIPDWVTFHLMRVPNPPALIWAVDALLLAAFGAGAWALRRRPALLAALGLSVLVVPLLFSLVSIWQPILLPRYILWSAAPFAMLAGIGGADLLARLSPRKQDLALGAAAVLLMLNLYPYYRLETKPRWDVASKLLASEVQPGDTIYLMDGYAKEILKAYLPENARAVVLPHVTGSLKQAIAAQAQGGRVWAVLGNAGQGRDNPDVAKFLTKAQALGTPAMTQRAGSRIFIALYLPGDGSQSVALSCPQQTPGGTGCS